MLKPVSDNTLRNVAAGSIIVGALSSLFFIGRSNGAVVVILLVSLYAGMAINSLRVAKPTAPSSLTALNPSTVWWRRPAWIVFLFCLSYALYHRYGH